MSWWKRQTSGLGDEMRAHIEFEIERNVAAGMTPQEARYAALKKFGNIGLAQEQSRDVWGWLWLERLWQDLRYALRGFARTPGFTVVAVLSLALGIGATTALFSVVYCVLITPYPYAKPYEIWAPAVVGLKEKPRGWHSYPRREFLEIQKLPTFADTMATSFEQMIVGGDRSPESFGGVQLSGGAFNFLGVQPLLGRTIQPFDIRPDGERSPVVVLSYGFWQRIYNADPGAIGKTLVLNEAPYTIIGVMPPRFGWFTNEAFWLPMPMDQRDETPLNVIVRLKPGITKTVAEQQLQSLNKQFAAAKPQSFPKPEFKTVLLNYMDITTASGEMTSSLRLLFAAVGFLLLIACANVANLQLARTTTRAREIAVRLSIGAGRWRLIRQLLTESVVLSVAGGALGILFAVGATRAIAALMPSFYVPNEARITVNAQVLLFSLAISLLTGILFGITPAFQCSRPNLVESLKDGGRGTGTGSRGQRSRSVLAMVEVALSVILLAGATVAIRNFAGLMKIDPGFRPERTLMLNVPLPLKQYKTLDQRNIFGRNLLEKVKNLPGVQAASLGNGGLPFGGPRSPFSLEGQAPAAAERIVMGLVSADYLNTLGIPLRRGREFTLAEIEHGDPLALINETAARLWPAGQDPIGKRIKVELLMKGPPQLLLPPGGTPAVTVIGVIGDTRNAGLRDATLPAVFVPYTLLAAPSRVLAVRTFSEPLAILNAVQRTVQEVDRQAGVSRPITMQEVLGFETVQPRFNMALFSCFAGLGLALAAAGIYSVISYDVTQRVHEIGVRVALGAGRADVLRWVLKMAARITGIGLLVGLVGSIVLLRIVRFQVFTSTAFDVASAMVVIAVLAAVALVASWAPARRATKLDPITALRHEA